MTNNVLDKFNIRYTRIHNRLTCPCPIHGGDNPNGFCLYDEGNWVCWTHHCEEEYGCGTLGLVAGLLSKNSVDKVSIAESRQWYNRNIGKVLDKPQQFSDICSVFREKEVVKSKDADFVGKISHVPSLVYKKRGYSDEILKKFLVGDCFAVYNELYNRTVFPVFDLNDHNKIFGLVGRSKFDRCQCGWYHSPLIKCPTTVTAPYGKWRNEYGFNNNSHLYNLWNAQEKILKTGCVFLVEGPGDAIRMYEAGVENVVAMFGTSLTKEQKTLLIKSGVSRLMILTDNDNAGETSREKINKQCENLFNIEHILLKEYNDIGDMTVEQIRKVI